MSDDRYWSDDHPEWPRTCPAGHRTEYPRATYRGELRSVRSFVPCRCGSTLNGGHRTHTCQVDNCLDPVTYEPPCLLGH